MLRTSQQQALANRACAQCNSPREEGLVACPNCKVPYRDADASALESLSIREAAIAAAVTKRAFKRVTWLFVAGFTVWSLITGGGLWQIYSDVRDYVTTLIAAKFDEASVRATLTETARTRASELMEKNLRPELDEAKAALHKELDAFRQANEFSQTVLMAQAEDRAAWDRLGIWAKDPEHPYATPAKQVWQAIIEAHNSGGLQGYVINWNNLGINTTASDRGALA